MESCAYAVWYWPKEEKLECCLLFATITKHSNLFLLDKHQTACVRCLLLNLLLQHVFQHSSLPRNLVIILQLGSIIEIVVYTIERECCLGPALAE